MSDNVTALMSAFNKLVEVLHESGHINANVLAERLIEPIAWLELENEGTLTLKELARETKQTAERCGKPGHELGASDIYPSTGWQMMFELTIQYLALQSPDNDKWCLDRLDFAEYLDLCALGMTNHRAPTQFVTAVQALADYSRGTSQCEPWLRDVLALRPLSGKDVP